MINEDSFCCMRNMLRKDEKRSERKRKEDEKRKEGVKKGGKRKCTAAAGW